MKHYLWNVLIGIDQFFNTLFGGAPDDTISASAAVDYRKGGVRGRVLCAFLNWLDPGHCEEAIKAEEDGRQQSDHFRP
jgi:hypothetical protein